MTLNDKLTIIRMLGTIEGAVFGRKVEGIVCDSAQVISEIIDKEVCNDL